MTTAITLPGCAIGRQTAPKYVDRAKQMWREGLACLETGRAGEAESWLRRAAEAQPEDAATQLHLAEALWQTGQQDEALGCVEQACLCDPQNEITSVRAGEMRLASEDPNRAVEWANQALDLNAQSAAAWSLRGRAYQRLGEPSRAMADFQQALRYAPNDAELLTDLALLHRANGDHQRCLITLRHVLDAYPPGEEPAGALALAGESYLALGRGHDASEALQLASARGEADADLICKLAEARAACGDQAGAIADAQRALQIDTEHETSRRLMARLQSSDAPLLR